VYLDETEKKERGSIQRNLLLPFFFKLRLAKRETMQPFEMPMVKPILATGFHPLQHPILT
jgi:hypothetical protein